MQLFLVLISGLGGIFAMLQGFLQESFAIKCNCNVHCIIVMFVVTIAIIEVAL